MPNKSTTPKPRRSRKSQPKKRTTAQTNESGASSSSSVSSNMSYVIFHGRKVFRVSEEFVKEMRKLQKSTATLIPKASFMRVVKEILQQYGEFRVQSSTLAALQEATEIYMTTLFEDTLKVAFHANRATVKPRDMKLVLELRNEREASELMTKD